MPVQYFQSFEVKTREYNSSYFNYTQNYFVERQFDFDVNSDQVKLDGIQMS